EAALTQSDVWTQRKLMSPFNRVSPRARRRRRRLGGAVGAKASVRAESLYKPSNEIEGSPGRRSKYSHSTESTYQRDNHLTPIGVRRQRNRIVQVVDRWPIEPPVNESAAQDSLIDLVELGAKVIAIQHVNAGDRR